MASFGPVDLQYSVPTWWRLWSSAVVMLGGFFLCVTTALAMDDGYVEDRAALATRLLVGIFLSLVGLVGVLLTKSAPRFHARRGSIEARDNALIVDGRAVGETWRCVLTRQVDEHEVAIFDDAGRKHPRFVMTHLNLLGAQRLIAALQDRETRTTTFRVALRSTVAGRIASVLGVIAVGVGGIVATMHDQPSWFLLAALGLIALNLPAGATVGRDGIVLSSLGVRSFVRFADVKEVERDRGVTLHLTDGRTIRVHGTVTHEEIDDLVLRVRKVRRDMLGTAQTERLLTRGSQEEKAWRDELVRLQQPGYRQQALERERLWEVYENPGADESARLGAAIMLRVEADADDAARLVRVARAIASPELREQLEEEDAPESRLRR